MFVMGSFRDAWKHNFRATFREPWSFSVIIGLSGANRLTTLAIERPYNRELFPAWPTGRPDFISALKQRWPRIHRATSRLPRELREHVGIRLQRHPVDLAELLAQCVIARHLTLDGEGANVRQRSKQVRREPELQAMPTPNLEAEAHSNNRLPHWGETMIANVLTGDECMAGMPWLPGFRPAHDSYGNATPSGVGARRHTPPGGAPKDWQPPEG